MSNSGAWGEEFASQYQAGSEFSAARQSNADAEHDLALSLATDLRGKFREFKERNAHLDPERVAASRVLYHMNVGEDFAGSDEEAMRYGIEEMGRFTHSLFQVDLDDGEDQIGLVGYADKMLSDEPTDLERLAFLHLMESYDAMDADNLNEIGRFGRALVGDPTSIGGIGALVSMGIKWGGKKAGKSLLSDKIKDKLRMSIAAAIEGGSFGYAYSERGQQATIGASKNPYYQKQVDHDAMRDIQSAGVAAAMSAALPFAGDAIKKMWDGTGMLVDKTTQHGTLGMGVGPIDDAPVNIRNMPSGLGGDVNVAELRKQASAQRFDEADTSYRIEHTAPTGEGASSLDDMSDIYPDDIYDPSVAGRYYGHGGEDVGMDNATAEIISQYKGNPDATVTIYRAVPKGVTDINEGDWVTVNPDYAHAHGGSWVDDGEYDVISKEVKASEVIASGDSIHEFGYVKKDLGLDIDSLSADEVITAYHGSPHSFAEFDFSYMGTGEGAQARGWGAYASSEAATAAKFREPSTGPKTEIQVNGVAVDEPTAMQEFVARTYAGDSDKALKSLNAKLARLQEKVDNASDIDKTGLGFSDKDIAKMELDGFTKKVNEVELMRDQSVKVAPRGNLYEVKLKTSKDELLDWDKPLSEQSDTVKKALKDAGVDMPDDTKGMHLYYNARPTSTNPKEASEALLKAGIKGVKYIDNLSAKGDNGPENYVVFDERLIEISKKFSVPIPVAALVLMKQEGQAQQDNEDL